MEELTWPGHLSIDLTVYVVGGAITGQALTRLLAPKTKNPYKSVLVYFASHLNISTGGPQKINRTFKIPTPVILLKIWLSSITHFVGNMIQTFTIQLFVIVCLFGLFV